MRLIRVVEATLLLSASLLWCEFGYHYYIFKFDCPGWPDQNKIAPGRNEFLRLLIIADTHIMGMVNSARIDKFRREWEMKQAFRIALKVYRPDVVVFLGDLFDEASFSSDEIFEEAVRDFEKVFSMDAEQERMVIPGNHDVGFHDQMVAYPHLLQRFTDKFANTKDIEFAPLPRASKLNIIVANSMSFANDTCPVCSHSAALTKQIALNLNKQAQERGSDFISPILLHHIPLYRLNDTGCDYPWRLRNKVRRSNIEGDDVMHSSPSKFLLSQLKPRLVISGHTHMLCKTTHSLGQHSFDELTISSFNHKNAEGRPGFLLLSVSRDNYLTQHCYLVKEWIIAAIYFLVVVLIYFRLIFNRRRKQLRETFFCGEDVKLTH